MDYAEECSIKDQIKNYDNLFVLRSLTKFFALPGLRSGYLMANSKNIEKVRKRQEPWSMNALAQRAGMESLKDNTYIQKSIKYVHEAGDALLLHDELEEINDRWESAASEIAELEVGLEKDDISVEDLTIVWMPM